MPDISIDGCLSVTHVMLDKMQLELVKGLLAMNLGEDIEEFEKPSTIIHDPVSQVKCVLLLYPIGRPVRATITLYPIGRPVRATITLYPIGRPVRATITLYPIYIIHSACSC